LASRSALPLHRSMDLCSLIQEREGSDLKFEIGPCRACVDRADAPDMLGAAATVLLHSDREDVILELCVDAIASYEQIAEWIDSGIGDIVATVKACLEHKLSRGT